MIKQMTHFVKWEKLKLGEGGEPGRARNMLEGKKGEA